MTGMDQARGYEIAGHPVICTHCQNDRFFTRRAILGSSGASFLASDWPNTGATNYICADCGHLMWFFDLPQEPDAGESAFTLDALLTEEETVEEDAIDPITDYEAPVSTMMPEPTECLSCGETIPSHQTKCQACGWSYRSESEAKTE